MHASKRRKAYPTCTVLGPTGCVFSRTSSMKHGNQPTYERQKVGLKSVLDEFCISKFDRLDLFHRHDTNFHIDQIGCVKQNYYLNNPEEQCSICLSNNNIPCVRLHQCTHVFHTACLESWINRYQFEDLSKKNHALCPICRTRFLTIKPMKSVYPTSESLSGACYDYYRKDHRNRMPASLRHNSACKTEKEIRNETNRLLSYLKANNKAKTLSLSESRLKKALIKPTYRKKVKKRGGGNLKSTTAYSR